MLKIAFATISALAVIIYVAFAFLEIGSITKEDLGISPNNTNNNCQRATLPFYTPYNQELAANDYLVYALASLGAYHDPDINRFVIKAYENGWDRLEQPLVEDLDYDVYLKKGELNQVIVAFRGTDFSNARDIMANASWFTGPFGYRARYDAARREFSRLRRDLSNMLGSSPITFVVTGHSLGGGLARHIAAGFPCVSAVVFDTSVVTNQYIFAEPFNYNIVVHLHDKRDELTLSQRLIFAEKDTPTYRWYPLELVAKGSYGHDITRFAVGMAGMTTNCQLDRQRGDPCFIPNEDARARNLYCHTYGHRDAICQPILRTLKDR